MPCSAIRPRLVNTAVNAALGRGEAQVAQRRQHEAAAGDDAVDGGDDRLGLLGEVAEQAGQLVVGRRPAGPTSRRPWWRRQHAGVEPGAEAPPGTGDDDPDHGGVGDGPTDGVADLRQHRVGERVQLLGPVERDEGDGVGHLVDDVGVGAHGPRVFPPDPSPPPIGADPRGSDQRAGRRLGEALVEAERRSSVSMAWYVRRLRWVDDAGGHDAGQRGHAQDLPQPHPPTVRPCHDRPRSRPTRPSTTPAPATCGCSVATPIADRAIRVATNSPVNHVAMVVALDDLPPLLWHTELGQTLEDVWTGTHHRGAQLNRLADAFGVWTGKYAQRAYVRQFDGEITRAMEDELLRVIDSLRRQAVPDDEPAGPAVDRGPVPPGGHR